MKSEIIRRMTWLFAAVVLLAGGITLLSSCASSKAPLEEPIAHVVESGVVLQPPSLDEAAKTQVMILGTTHLATLGDKFDSSHLSSLLATLEEFNPDMIAVEQLHPQVIQAMLDRGEEFASVLEQFAGAQVRLAQSAQELLGLDPCEASAEASALLERLENPSDSSAASPVRARLILHHLAAYEYASALLQWSYLLDAGESCSDIIPQEVADALGRQLGASSEDMTVCIELARRLGLQRVEAIDDHMDKDLFLQIAGTLVAQLQGDSTYESAAAAPVFTESTRRLEQAVEDGDLLPYYLYQNSMEYGKADVDAQFHVFFRTRLPSGLDRARSALWEVRNLNIASHIRRITAMHPGKRVLVVIGAGHKPFLDAYLREMMDLKIVHLSDLVGGTQ